MSDAAALPLLTNARFLQIAGEGSILAGTIYNHPQYPDGSTYYSHPIEHITATLSGEDIARTGQESIRFTRGFH